jgi:dUTPase
MIKLLRSFVNRFFYPEIELQVLDDAEGGSGGFGSTGKN